MLTRYVSKFLVIVKIQVKFPSTCQIKKSQPLLRNILINVFDSTEYGR